MIEGVKIKQLRVIPDERGRLMEILRSDDQMYEAFGQVYMTTAYPGIVKSWHFHKLQSDNFTCVYGKVLFALYDGRVDSPTHGQINDFIMSPDKPLLIHIPKEVYHGFKNIGDSEALVINTVTQPYNHKNPDEYRLDAFDKKIGYNWDRKE